MADWTIDKPSHVDTWFSLFRLGQIRKPFNESAEVKMKELTFYNPTASKDLLKVDATLIAVTIDRVFTGWGAKLENSKSRNTAVLAMIEILMDKDKTILDLAEENDKNYFFNNERSIPS